MANLVNNVDKWRYIHIPKAGISITPKNYKYNLENPK